MAEVAVLAAGAGGAYLGSLVGGPLGASIGWGIGSAIGSELFGPDVPEVEGPRLGDLSVQSSAYGQPLPHIDGVGRVAGNVIWSSGIAETPHTEEVGGKGGGGEVTQVSYTYGASFAISIHDGEIEDVTRVWADGKLIYDMGPSATAESVMASLANIPLFRVYKGDESQLPDPLIQAEMGADEVPAYRGTAYLVFEDFQLADYGNRLPNITVEIVSAGASAWVTNQFVPVPNYNSANDPDWNNSAANVNINGEFTCFVGQWDNGYSGYQVAEYTLFAGIYTAKSEFTANSNSAFAVGISDEACFVNKSSSGNRYYYTAGEARSIYFDVPELMGLTQVRFVKKGQQLYIGSNGFGSKKIYEFSLGDSLGLLQRSSSVLPGYAAAMDVSDLYVYVLSVSLNVIYKLSRADLGLVETITITSGSGGTNASIRVMSDSEIYVYRGSAFYRILSGVVSSESLPTSINKQSIFDTNGDVIYLFNRSGSGGHIGHRLMHRAPGASSYTVGDVVSNICIEAGLNPADIDVSQLTQTITGYVRSRPMSARAAIAPLQRAYFFDAVETDGILRFVPRGGASVATINEDELGAYQNGQTPPSALLSIRAQEIDLPREVAVHYINPAFNYQPGIQRNQRQVTLSQQKIAVQLPIAMSDDHAAQIAEILLFNTWAERQKIPLQLGIKYAWLDAADVIHVVGNNASYDLRINKITTQNPGLLQLETVVEQADIYTSEAVGEASPVPDNAVAQIGPTEFYFLDIPLLQDADDNAGFYLSAHGLVNTWPGAVLYKTSDNGASWYQVTSVVNAATTGRCITKLADGLSTVWDNHSLTVKLQHGALEASTEAAVLNGANAAVVGNPDNARWEIIQFQDAVLNGDGTYTISRLLRGRKGTEWATGTHQVNDIFILLSGSTLTRYNPGTDQIGVSALYKTPAIGSNLISASEESFTNQAVALKPYAPVHLSGKRDGSSNLSISWIRRSRIGGEWRDNVGVVVGEDSQSYEVDIMNGAVVVRTLTSTTPTLTYTAADQVTDFGSAQASIDVNIYQLSATVGRGYPGAATL